MNTKPVTAEWLEGNCESSYATDNEIQPYATESEPEPYESESELEESLREDCEIEITDEPKKPPPEEPTKPFPWPLIRHVALGMFSVMMFALFVLAAASQVEGVDSVSWILFYTLNAAVPVIFLVYWACCFPAMILHILAMVTGVWSIIYLIIAALKINDTDQWKDHLTMPQNSIIVMASIGFFSSMYHSIMAEHCINKDDGRDDDE